MDERNQALTTVRQALPVFQQINDLYCAADSIYQKASLQDAQSAGKAGNTKGKAIAMAALTWFGLDILYYILFGALNVSGTLAVFYVIGSIICAIIVYFKVSRSTNQSINEQHNAMIQKYEQDLECISNDICEIYHNNEEIISTIPRDYRTYDAVSYFERLLENGHADSLKEALILYDEYLHRQSMLRDNQRIIQQNIQQREMLMQIEQSANAAARSSNVAAAFSIATYLSVNR